MWAQSKTEGALNLIPAWTWRHFPQVLVISSSFPAVISRSSGGIRGLQGGHAEAAVIPSSRPPTLALQMGQRICGIKTNVQVLPLYTVAKFCGQSWARVTAKCRSILGADEAFWVVNFNVYYTSISPPVKWRNNAPVQLRVTLGLAGWTGVYLGVPEGPLHNNSEADSRNVLGTCARQGWFRHTLCVPWRKGYELRPFFSLWAGWPSSSRGWGTK